MAIGETTEERRERLDNNESYCLKKMQEEGIAYKQLGDFHYLVEGVYDYWPRTGLFINRKNKHRQIGGIHQLIKVVKKARGEKCQK